MNATLTKYWVQLTAEPRKAAVLGVLALVAVIMIGRSVLMASGGPSKAAASTRTRATKTSGEQGEATKTTIVFRAMTPIRDPDAPPMLRDIFALNEERFPKVSPNNAPDASGAKSDGGIDDIADDLMSAQWVEERVRTQAQRLRLRSTLMGATPMAVIEHGDDNARRRDVLRVGDAAAGFTLVEVSRHWVEVERDGVRVRLDLPAPLN